MIFRIILGLYLTCHFIQLIPWAEELFGNSMPYDPTISPVYGILPNILDFVNATYFIVFLTFLSIIFTLEIYPRFVSLLLWYGWACTFNRNILIHNPGIHYIGWILLALSLVVIDGSREVFYTSIPLLKKIQHDKLPTRIFWSAWFLMAAGYTSSGLHKLVTSPSWLDGTALQHILGSSLARDNFLRDYLITCPIFLMFSTWLALFLEISFLPLGVFYHTRFYYWFLYVGFHMGILVLINFSDLTIGVLMIHLCTFDWRWLNHPVLKFVLTKLGYKYKCKND